MGCIVIKRPVKEEACEKLRRRLSLGEIDDPTGEEEGTSGADVTDDDRSLLLHLSQQQIFDFLKNDAAAGRRYSIGTETDLDLNSACSFSSKTTKLEGNTFGEAEKSVGFACKKGLKPEAPNQDSFLIMKIEDKYALYGVFDGHGRRGHDVSNFVKDVMPKVLFSQEEFVRDPQEALIKTFAKVQHLLEKATCLKTIDATRSGTTCSIVLHVLAENMLYVAHVGDSRVVLGRKVQTEEDMCEWQAADLTIDHKPDLPEERERIERNGGVVVFDGGWNYRVFAKGKRDARGKRYPGLNMSRAMGDLQGYHDAGISAVPDVNKRLMAVQPAQGASKKVIKQRDNQSESDSQGDSERAPSISSYGINPNTDKFLLLCSDGVWEFISSEVAVNEVARFPVNDAMPAAEHLCACSWDNWIREMDGQVVDDITSVIVHL